MKQIFRKTIFFLLGSLFCGTAWGQVTVPTPVYFNNFSSTEGLTIVGNGVFEDDADARFGRIFHNDPTNTSAVRTNYLKLPTNVLSHSATSKEMTIGFWVNKKGENDFWFMPLFTAYGAAPVSNVNTSPMFACQARGLLQVNCAGWCNFDNTDNDNSTNYEGTYWLDDGAWHYYSVALTETTAKVYVDGSIVNSWTVDKSDGHNISGLFTNGSGLTYVCLGGNQSWDWDNADPAFGFDDFAVYDEALTPAQIKKIIKDKLVTGTQIGEVDCSTTYLTESSNKIVLRPGESAKFRFINYIKNTGAANNEAWHLIVADPDNTNKIVIRADWWDDINGSTVAEHQSGFSSNAANYWANVPSKMNWATVDMEVSFTADKKLVMTSTTTPLVGDPWTYNYTSDNDNNINLNLSSIKVALSVNLSWIDLLSNSITKTLSGTGWSTFASENGLDFSSVDGLTAYVVTDITNTTVKLTSVDELPANSGVILKGTANATYTIPVKSTASYDGTNKLYAAVTPYVCTANEVYIMQGGEFHLVTAASTVPAGKAYLLASDVPSGARSLDFFFDDETTGVTSIEKGQWTIDNAWYNLNGQKVLNPTKGLYIVNGKKVVIK